MTAANLDSSELADLYRELILDHARHPRHFGKLEGATHSAEGINPLCGDKLKLYLKLDGAGQIEEAAFEGTGCAISVASASLLTDCVTGTSQSSALTATEDVVARLTGSDPARALPLDKLAALDGVREFPARVKCATLAWHALAAAINEAAEPATTE